MGWATSYITRLQNGETITFNAPNGRSMIGRIDPGQRVTIVPEKIENLKKDDIVLCSVRGQQYLHLVKAIRHGQVLIGNNHGRINGWTSKIFGRVTAVG